MNRLGIKYQILLITFIPAFLIDVFFTYSHITTSFTQAQELLQNQGRIISRQIAGASEYNLFSGNNQQIKYILDQTVDTDNIILAAVYGIHGELIAESVSEMYRAKESSDYYYYHRAIQSQSITGPDVFSPDQAEGPQNSTIGWVHIYLSRDQLNASKTTIIHESIIFFIFALILTLVLTIVISRGITTPIFKLMEHLRKVETGHLGEFIEPVELNEIGAVQQGFNRMTQALFTNSRHLNDRIQQATQQLSEAITDLETKNRELGFARDEAQNANRIKSEFLANMSHEIRTPINGIRGFISLMAQSDLNSQQMRYADIIHKSTSDLTNIIEEILDFSKLESGKLQIVEDDFDLYELIEQARDILFIGVINKNIDLILIIYSDTPQYVSGDKLRLKQILLNLMRNAIKFTDEGQVVIRVEIEQESSTEVEIVVTVEDTGIGIAEQDQEELFTAFRQVESASNRRYSGTGLGLAICKNLVNLMGGEITMKSQLGRGSTFSFCLPFSIPADEIGEDSGDDSNLSALIFSSKAICLQEIQSLFDRAGVNTEGSLVASAQSIDGIKSSIQQNRHLINIVVFDLRHAAFGLDELVDIRQSDDLRVIVMHYDQSMVNYHDLEIYEFISIVTTSSQLRRTLNTRAQENSSEFQTIPRQACAISKQVLLVDDNQINLTLGGELIRLWGHQTTEAIHAQQALTLYRKNNFDLIILDIQMPDIDGTDLLKLMREEKPEDSTPVVALTANIMQDEAERLLKLGFDYYLSKPIDEEKLKAILDGNGPKIDTVQPESEPSGNIEDLPTIDLKKSLLLTANSESLLKQIFEILLKEIPAYQNQLEDALKQSDRNKISLVIHKIHGVTCYASLPKIRQQVLTIEQLMTRNPTENIDIKIKDIIEELSCIKSAAKTQVETKALAAQ